MKNKPTIMLMRTKPITIISTFAFFALSLSSLCAATLVTAGAQNTTFTTTDNSMNIPLSISAPLWTLNQSTADTAAMNIHSLVGYTATTGKAAAGWQSGKLRVGAGDSRDGAFAWKFTLLDGQTTTGGTISANISFFGTPSTQKAGAYLGVGQTFVPTGGLLNFNQAAFTQVGLASTSTTYGNYTETWSVNVPTGLSTFFVVFAKMGSSSGIVDLNSLQTNITAIPEPSTSAMIGIGFSMLLALSRYKRRAS
jgi:hypothetical protein